MRDTWTNSSLRFADPSWPVGNSRIRYETIGALDFHLCRTRSPQHLLDTGPGIRHSPYPTWQDATAPSLGQLNQTLCLKPLAHSQASTGVCNPHGHSGDRAILALSSSSKRATFQLIPRVGFLLICQSERKGAFLDWMNPWATSKQPKGGAQEFDTLQELKSYDNC